MAEIKPDSRSILIVDDQDGVRMTLSLILSKKGFFVAEADDGLTAIEAIRSHDYDVILMDVKMPGMNGLDALTQIKALSPKSVVIMMTADPSEENMSQALFLGAFAVLHKPFGIEALMDVLDRCLN